MAGLRIEIAGLKYSLCHRIGYTKSPFIIEVGAFMGWFSKSSGDFFLSSVVPQGQGGAQVAQFLGLVNGEAIIGANIFRDVFSSVRDVVGGRAGGYERALAGAREAALDEAKAAAKELGANGIVGIDFDYEVLGEANGMMLVSVTGTAVKMA